MFWEICSVFGSIVLIGYSIFCSNIIMNSYFLIGSFLALRGIKYVENKKKDQTILGIIGMVLCIIWILPEGRQGGQLWILLMIAFVWNALDLFEFKKEPEWWQKQTFFFYCAHSFLLEALEKIWLIIAGRSVWAAALDYFFMPLIIVGMLSMVAFVLNKYVTPLYQVLTGSRNC